MNRKANIKFRAADPFVKCFLIKSYCLPLYGATLWSLSSSSIRLIEVNKILRKVWNITHWDCPLHCQNIRAWIDALCTDDTSEISRDPRTKRLQTRRESLAVSWCRHLLVSFLFHALTSLHPPSFHRNDFSTCIPTISS